MRDFRFLGILILILDIVAIVEIFRSSKDMTHKLLWSLLILFAPLLGLLVYFFFGRGGGSVLPKS